MNSAFPLAFLSFEESLDAFHCITIPNHYFCLVPFPSNYPFIIAQFFILLRAPHYLLYWLKNFFYCDSFRYQPLPLKWQWACPSHLILCLHPRSLYRHLFILHLEKWISLLRGKIIWINHLPLVFIFKSYFVK